MRKTTITGKITRAALLTAALAVAATMPLRAAEVGLNQGAVVEGNVLTLGDVFTGLSEEHGRKILGAAPLPGQDMVLNARTLLRIALAMDLPWRPASNADAVVVSRAGTIVDKGAVEEALRGALATEGLQGNYTFSFSGALPQIVLPAGQPAAVEIDGFSIRPGSGVFEATAYAPAKAAPVKSFRVAGTIHRMVEVPVLSETLSKGSVIGVNDIQTIEMREEMLKDNFALSAAELIGRTPRGVIIAGKPVSKSDIAAPRAVTRGDMVTMVFSEGSLVLTAQGKALEHGAAGDTIRVVNTSSNKTLQAEVTAEKEVTVKSF